MENLDESWPSGALSFSCEIDSCSSWATARNVLPHLDLTGVVFEAGFSRLQGSSHVFDTGSHDSNSNILIQLCKEPAPRIGAGIVLLQAENGVPCEPSRRISQLAECRLHHLQ